MEISCSIFPSVLLPVANIDYFFYLYFNWGGRGSCCFRGPHHALLLLMVVAMRFLCSAVISVNAASSALRFPSEITVLE